MSAKALFKLQKEFSMANITDYISKTKAASAWEALGIEKKNGIVIPLFSLHSKESSGIGEFTDLELIIPWCAVLGLSVIQLLPLNDTGPSTSPYGAISAFALNPIHLGLAHLPNTSSDPVLKSMLTELKKFNETKRVEYEKIYPLRNHFLKEYFKKYSESILSSENYRQFYNDNTWLDEYSLFKALKEDSNWQNICSWPNEIRFPTKEKLAELKSKFEVRIDFHNFVQYFCFQQMKQVKEMAKQHHVFLKGDIPILLDKESASVWLNKDFFLMNYTAGAPPDSYSDEGQNWQFPLYNWEKMELDNYRWWKQRLSLASRLYDIYRIDHIVGFYRIWGIPIGKNVREGGFIPENSDLWIEHGEKIMSMMIDATPMLPIGEDLGSVPNEVRASLTSLGICGTKVVRWERYWNEYGAPYIASRDYAPLGVTTVSTHDSETLRQWWETSFEEASAYAKSRGWDYMTPLTRKMRQQILKDSNTTTSLFHIHLLHEYLAGFSDLVWNDPQLERINIPGVISPNNWTYRFKDPIETIIKHNELAEFIKSTF